MPNNAPARIALFLPRLSRYGGVEGFACRLAEALAGAGHAVDFVCSRVETAPPQGVRPVRLPRLGLTRAEKTFWFAVGAEIVRRRGGYDLTIGLGKTLRQDVLRLSGGPQRTFWELSARAWPEGWPRSWKMLKRRLAPTSWLTRWIEREQLKHTPVLAANSDRVADWVRRDHPELAGREMTVIYNRPDLTRFSPGSPAERTAARAAWGAGPDETIIGVAGSNFALKGVGTLIRALTTLPERCRLIVAGGRNAGRYETLARRLGVADRVRFAGRVDDMVGFYRACDVFALPTFYDACSNAVLEALACGARVISSADNGSSVFLPPERVLADPASPARLAEAIQAALAAPPPSGWDWPTDRAAGLEPWLELAAGLLADRRRREGGPA